MIPLFTVDNIADLPRIYGFRGDTLQHDFRVSDARVLWTDCYERDDYRDFPNPWSGWGQVSLGVNEPCTVDVIITDSGGIPAIWHRYLQNPPGGVFVTEHLLSEPDMWYRYNVLIDHKLVAACDVHTEQFRLDFLSGRKR